MRTCQNGLVEWTDRCCEPKARRALQSVSSRRATVGEFADVCTFSRIAKNPRQQKMKQAFCTQKGLDIAHNHRAKNSNNHNHNHNHKQNDGGTRNRPQAHNAGEEKRKSRLTCRRSHPIHESIQRWGQFVCSG